MKKLPLTVLLVLSLSHPALAGSVRSAVNGTDGQSLGEVVFEDTPYGLLITPKLTNLPPAGLHGFHLHEHPNCGDKGMNAGGHFDPRHTNTHQGPYGNGHLGDLPVLATDSKGSATIPLLAPRLKTADLAGRALMIHAGGDTYSDTPPLGGGGARIGCGVIAAGQ